LLGCFAVDTIGSEWSIGSSGLLVIFVCARVLPKLARDLERINSSGLPPGPLIAGAMSRSVMDTSERYREFIACLTTKRARLHKPQVMRIGRLARAQEAWL